MPFVIKGTKLRHKDSGDVITVGDDIMVTISQLGYDEYIYASGFQLEENDNEEWEVVKQPMRK